MKGSKGYRRRSRSLRLKVRERSKVGIRRYIQNFKNNDQVAIKIDSSYQRIPHPRFDGKGGRVVGKKGRAYRVRIKDGGKTKEIIVTPEHLIPPR